MTFPGHRLPVLSALLIGVVLFACLWLGAYAISPAPGSSTDHVEVVIPARSKVSDISRILAEKNIIKDDPRFSMLAVLTGTARKLRAGEYRFEPGTTPLEILDFLKQGRVLYRKVVFPEGTELSGIADILAAEGWVDRNRFLDLANDPDFVREMGIEAESLEGYLFPDTYKLSRGQQDEVSVIRMMVSNHFSVYSELSEGESGNSHGMTHHEIITLASIVEKETGVVEERGLVASVFLNRLERGMMLQADPTVRYGIPGRTGPLTREDLKNPTPYNTYIIKGLPPGPITNPGRAAIEAVVNPENSEYLYFVSKDDRSHHFSRTLKEHNRAVAKYRNRK